MEEDNRGSVQQNSQYNQSSQQGAGFVVQNLTNTNTNTVVDSGSITSNNGVVNGNIDSNNAGKVVSLKGGLTKKEIEEQKRIEKLKKRAVKLERKLTPKEKELERMHQKAVKPAMFTANQKLKVESHKVAKPDNFSNSKGNSGDLFDTVKNGGVNNNGVNKDVSGRRGINDGVIGEKEQIEAVESLINPIEEKKQESINKKQKIGNKEQTIMKKQNTGYRVQDTRYKIQDTKSNMQGISGKIQGARGKIQETVNNNKETRNKEQATKSEIQETKYREQDMRNKEQGAIIKNKIVKQVGWENDKSSRTNGMENNKSIETNGGENKFHGLNRRMVISPGGQISYVNYEGDFVNTNKKELNSNNQSKVGAGGKEKNVVNARNKKGKLGDKITTKLSNGLDDKRMGIKMTDTNTAEKQRAFLNNIADTSKASLKNNNRGLAGDMMFKTKGGSEETLEEWSEKKVDLKGLSSEKRLDIQATPMTASVSWKMDEDTNGMVANWFKRSDELPVNIKLGLGDAEIRKEIISLIESLGMKNEESAGEVSRIIRDVYVNLIKGDEVIKRLKDRLKIPQDKINEVIKKIASIVAKVKAVGNKKSDEYYDKVTIKKAIEKYPKVAQQEITNSLIFDKSSGETIEPTVQNWINDYINFAGSGMHTSLERGRYLVDSKNVKNLDDREKKCLENVLESYDDNKIILIDKEEEYLMCWLHTDESKLGINSDKNKRVINKFKIEEAQTTDVDTMDNNLENGENKGIIKNRTSHDRIENSSNEQTLGKNNNSREEFLDLSSEIPANK